MPTLALTFLWVAFLAFHQNAPVSTRPATGQISGRVIDGASGRPLPGAYVEVLQLADRQTNFPFEPGGSVIVTSHSRRFDPVVTDDRGAFTVGGLPAGAFDIQVGKSGWSHGPDPSHTSRDFHRRLSAGERVSDITVALWRIPVVEGRITDDRGQPVAGVDVVALTRISVGGHPHYKRASFTTTDDRGQYDLPLHPGRYVLAALLEPQVLRPQTPRPVSANGRARVYRTTFYPGTHDSRLATPIELAPGDNRNYDMQLAVAAAFRVTAAFAVDLPQVRPELVRPDDGVYPNVDYEIAFPVRKPGGFTFEGVPPGEYQFRLVKDPGPPMGAHSNPPLTEIPAEPTLYVDQPLIVVDRDVNIQVSLREGVRLSGRVEFDGSLPPPHADALNRRAFDIVHANGEHGSLKGFFPTNDRFGTMQIPPGRYLLRPGAPDGWTLKSVTVGGRDVTDAPLDVGTVDVGNIVITFTDRLARIAGRVLDSPTFAASRSSVTIFPAERELWRDYGRWMRRLMIVQPGSPETFEATLPEGQYYAIASDWGLGHLRTPERFAALAARATLVTLVGGQTITQDLRVQRID